MMQNKAVKGWRWLLAAVLFIGIGLLLYGRISEVLRRKSGAEADMIHTFYDVKKDSLDVLFLGSSHLYYGVQPNVLWREYGIAAYDMGSAEQTVASSYFLLTEALAYQKPEVVVLETYYLWYPELYNGEARLRQAFDGMRYGKAKREMLDVMLPELDWKERMTYCLPFLKYHERWDALEDYDFHTKPYLRGARIDYTVAKVEDPGLPEEASDLPKLSLEYLEKLWKLCEENDTELVLLAIPYGSEADTDRYLKRQGMNLTLEDWARERGIPFRFYQKEEPELIDFATDFRDQTHLNTEGAGKLTADLGAWLAKDYALPDHRGDRAYSSYEEDLQRYEADTVKAKEHPENTADAAGNP